MLGHTPKTFWHHYVMRCLGMSMAEKLPLASFCFIFGIGSFRNLFFVFKETEKWHQKKINWSSNLPIFYLFLGFLWGFFYQLSCLSIDSWNFSFHHIVCFVNSELLFVLIRSFIFVRSCHQFVLVCVMWDMLENTDNNLWVEAVTRSLRNVCSAFGEPAYVSLLAILSILK